MLVGNVNDAFRLAFLITGGLALVAALTVWPPPTRGLRTAAIAGVAALALPLAHGLAKPALGPEPIRIADPCKKREPPNTGGIGGFMQDAALLALDRAACRFGTSREELVLALVDEESARDYEDEHGVNPRSPALLGGILGL